MPGEKHQSDSKNPSHTAGGEGDRGAENGSSMQAAPGAQFQSSIPGGVLKQQGGSIEMGDDQPDGTAPRAASIRDQNVPSSSGPGGSSPDDPHRGGVMSNEELGRVFARAISQHLGIRRWESFLSDWLQTRSGLGMHMCRVCYRQLKDADGMTIVMLSLFTSKLVSGDVRHTSAWLSQLPLKDHLKRRDFARALQEADSSPGDPLPLSGYAQRAHRKVKAAIACGFMREDDGAVGYHENCKHIIPTLQLGTFLLDCGVDFEEFLKFALGPIGQELPDNNNDQ